MNTIAVLLTCHNRREKTLNCLSNLYNTAIPEGYSYDVYLVDDSSTDGTGLVVRTKFPSVNIIQGDGNLFWNRGMHLAWETAAKTKNYDFYIWLNDDTMLYPNALQIILNAAQTTNATSIICGTTRSAKTKRATYGGRKKQDSQILIPNGDLQECSIINGNFTLIPRIIYQSIGNLDFVFRHAIGDHDYGLRAKKAGFKIYVASEYIGTCEPHQSLPKWCLAETPIIERLRVLYSPLGNAEPFPFFIYEKRHWGLLTAVKHFTAINLRALFPQLWK